MESSFSLFIVAPPLECSETGGATCQTFSAAAVFSHSACVASIFGNASFKRSDAGGPGPERHAVQAIAFISRCKRLASRASRNAIQAESLLTIPALTPVPATTASRVMPAGFSLAFFVSQSRTSISASARGIRRFLFGVSPARFSFLLAGADSAQSKSASSSDGDSRSKSARRFKSAR